MRDTSNLAAGCGSDPAAVSVKAAIASVASLGSKLLSDGVTVDDVIC